MSALTRAALLALPLAIAACHHHRRAEGPVQKTKEVVKDLGHDTKEAAKDVKNDLKK